MAVSENGDAEALGIVFFIVAFVLMLIGSLLINVLAMLIITPMMLGTGLAEEIGPAIDFQFIKGFVRLTWKEATVAFLLLFAAFFGLSLVGMAFFCIGHILIAPWIWLAMAHLNFQLYALYLQRGGTPVKAKPATSPA